MKKTFVSEYFEFLDWRKCFDRFRELQDTYGDNLRLTIATKFYVSGYWIERVSFKTYDGDIIYTGDDVDKLEKRIIQEHETAKKEERGVLFTT